MQLATKIRDFESTVQAPRHDFTIAASAKMFHILSNSLYKHKELAIVRELVANAYDAHLRAGTTDQAFDVHLPTSLEPFFQIYDRGTGLSEQGIYDLYTRYGSSDKTNTNSEIGGFGLGSKSPFAYTDQFTVESRHNGVRMQFQAFMDEHGMPSIMKIAEEPTTEPNGLTVTIPAGDDYDEFVTVAQRVLPFVPTAYTCNQQEYIPELDYVSEYSPQPDIIIKTRRNAKTDASHEGARVIMGIVAYPLDPEQFPYASAERDLAELPIDIYAPIGAFDIAASRESLSYSRATKEALTALLGAALIPMCTATKSAIENAPNLLTAYEHAEIQARTIRRILDRYVEQHPACDQAIRDLAKWFDEPTWNGGQSLKYVPLPADVAYRHVQRKNGRKYTKIDITDYYHMQNGVASLYISDLFIHDYYSVRLYPVYWKENGRNATRFFEGLGHRESRMLIGERDAVERFCQSIGLELDLDANEVADMPMPKKARSKYGAHQYWGCSSKNSRRTQQTASEWETHGRIVLFQDGYHADKFLAEYMALVARGFLRDHEVTAVVVPPAHNRVWAGLLKAGAGDGRTATPGAHPGERIAHCVEVGVIEVDEEALHDLFARRALGVYDLLTDTFTASAWRGFRTEDLAEPLDQAGFHALAWYLERRDVGYAMRNRPMGSGHPSIADLEKFVDPKRVERGAEAYRQFAQCQAALQQRLDNTYPLLSSFDELAEAAKFGDDARRALVAALLHYCQTINPQGDVL